MADSGQTGGGGSGGSGHIIVMTCVECGRDYEFDADDGPPPADLTCDRCGNQVFRRFDAADVPDEVESDFRESTERDLATDDPAGDATAGDLHDLNNP